MRRRVRLWAVAAVLTASASAAAQGPHPTPPAPIQSALQEQNQDQPVQIDAQTLEIRDKSKIATFSGNVQVVQGDTTMKCRTLVVFYGQEMGLSGDKPAAAATAAPGGTPPNAQNIRRIEARGDVTVATKDQNASGDLGVYDLKAKTITLSGNVVVSQGKNVIHGERVVVDTVTGNAHVEAAPGATQSRVRALIVPNKDQNGGQTNFMTIGPGPTK
ncbi:MAG: LptA/OstA family protein [Xanthobacteraceae bacterium]